MKTGLTSVSFRKLSLWKEYEHNLDAYTNAKTEFVKKYTEKAKAFMVIDTNKFQFIGENTNAKG